MKSRPTLCGRRRGPARVPAPGITLMVALVMLVVLGLAAAAILRSALGAGRLANDDRLLTQAEQDAAFALRFCEGQLALPAFVRTVAAQSAAPRPRWTLADSWLPGGSAHTLSASEIGGTVPPRVPPQFLVEATALADVYTVTARGFEADAVVDPHSGAVRRGGAVWLQSTLIVPAQSSGADRQETASGAGARGPRRVWQRLLTPPV